MLFTLVIIHSLVIAIPNVLVLNILLLMSSHLKSVCVPGEVSFIISKPGVQRETSRMGFWTRLEWKRKEFRGRGDGQNVC